LFRIQLTRMLRSFFYLVVISSPSFFFSQEIITKGVPYINNYKNQLDKIYSHTWAIDEAPNKVMYFVNDKGLLVFDGATWMHFKGSKGITRSIKVVNNNLIYTGSDNDFGEWKLNDKNEFEYTSLYEKIKSQKVIEEFWNVFSTKDGIVFQSFDNLYLYKNGNFTVIKAPKRFLTGYQTPSSVYIIDEKEGLMIFEGNYLKNIPILQSIDFKEIVAIDKNLEDIRLITKNKGIYSIKNNQFIPYSSISFFPQNDIVFCHKRINSNYSALGTIQNGVLILTNKGEIVHKINKIKGLQNNTVLSMHFSSAGSLWLGLDFGIDALNLNTPISYVKDYLGELGTAYTAYLQGQTLYLGTNQGLYSIPFETLQNNQDKYSFQLVPKSQGQVWTIHKVDNMVVIGHDKGLFNLTNNQLLPIDNKPGVWTILNYKNYVLTGNYEGVYAYKKTVNGLEFYKKIPQLVGSFKQLLAAQDKLYAQLPNVGLLEFELDTNLNLKNKKLYKKERFCNSPFQIVIKDQNINLITLDSIYSKPIGSNQGFKSEKFLQIGKLKEQLLEDYFLPSSINSSYELYSIYNGFSIKDLSIKKREFSKKDLVPLIRDVEAFDNFLTIHLLDKGNVNYNLNNIRFKFVLPAFADDIDYQYTIDSNMGWNEWSQKTTAEFLDLKEGRYKFMLRARYLNSYSDIVEFEFRIKPPFYRSWWAYILYLMFIVFIIYSVKSYNRQKLEKQRLKMLKKQKESLREQSQRYQEKLDKERQEKLELEQIQLKRTIENKEFELAKKTMEQFEFNDMVISIKKKLEDVQSNSKEKLQTNSYSELMQFIDKKLNSDLSKEYELAFDNSQSKFHENLLKSHSNLSIKDLRICSYIMMNLSSKEISKIFNVLPSSIDVSRSRLRKKLNLSEDDNLRDYLMPFAS
jgi:AraC family chitin signaling transcriptional activator